MRLPLSMLFRGLVASTLLNNRILSYFAYHTTMVIGELVFCRTWTLEKKACPLDGIPD